MLRTLLMEEIHEIRELYPDVITEDTSYEYKAVLNPDSPIKWAKLLLDMQMIRAEPYL